MHAVHQLTEAKVKNAKARDRNYKIQDGNGLYLFVSVAGGRTWRYDYAFNGSRKTLTIGKYPSVSLKEAREKHNAAMNALASGIDPASEKRKLKS